MARLKLHSKVIATIIVTLVLASCTTIIDWDNQFDDLSLNQSYIIPLGETTMSFQDILDQYDSLEFINRTENNVYVIHKDSNEWKFREMVDLTKLEVLVDEFVLPGFIIPADKTVSKDIDHTLTLGYNSNPTTQRVDSADINSAKIQMQINVSNLDIQPGNIQVTTTFVDNTVVFEDGKSYFVHKPKKLNEPEIIPLPPFKILTANNLNAITVKVKVEVIAGNTAIFTSPGSKIGLNYKLFALDPKVFYGYFSPTIAIASQDQVVDISEFTSLLPSTGVFKLAEPSILVDVLNNTGVKMSFNIDYINAYKLNDATFDSIYAKFNNSKSVQHVIDRVQTYKVGGATVKSSFVLDHTLQNGDISHFFDTYPLPTMIKYKFAIKNARTLADPADFIIPTASVKAYFTVKVPLKFNAGSQFVLRDTLKNVNLEEVLVEDQVEKAQLVLKITNGLPMKGVMSLSFLTASKQLIPDLQLLADSTVKAPEINADGTTKAGSKAISYINFVIEKSQIPKLKLAKNIVYSFKVISEADKKVSLQKTDSLQLKMGVYLKGNNIINF